MASNRRYLVTGGTGFLGQALITRLRADPTQDVNIVVIARDEGNLDALVTRFPGIETIAGDIVDPYACARACQDVDGIYHLAAFKYVGLAESNVQRCIISNVMGTLNLLEETRRVQPAFIIGTSTDKAAKVEGVYGATKFLQERLFLEYETMHPDTRYRQVRFGNILFSTGSVLCKWRDRLKNHEEILVTDPTATRFYWSADAAVDCIFDCLRHTPDAHPYTPMMKAASVRRLLDAMIRKYDTSGSPKIRTIGLQSGESLHEVISVNGPDSSAAEQYTDVELDALV